MSDFMPLRRIDHIRFIVGNAKQAAYFYHSLFGFDMDAYSGLETGNREEAGYVLRQQNVRFVMTSPYMSDHPHGKFLNKHGDAVKDVAFEVDDVEKAYREATKRGAVSIAEPHEMRDDEGVVRLATIGTYGDCVHTFINRDEYRGVFLPGFRKEHVPGEPVGISDVDHVVGNVELGKMDVWVRFYNEVLGFENLLHFTDKDISTEYSALMSKVVQGGGGKIKLPINEPAEGRRKSQIEEYLVYNTGPGVQHIALETSDVIHTVRCLRQKGLMFTYVPEAYYEALPDRVGQIDEDLRTVGELGILVDRDEEGYLLQIFTKTVQDKPTLFYEVIQRKGSRGFGKGNFKALFEAIEREQAARGNL
ncbi:MAG: 4-hydroxyphenylpyruvate dioxygenase [Armatimonadetes bacterium]|nr:4-hydroxyphenylpyruvate dioxygenase [Armatimonadota bacterium]